MKWEDFMSVETVLDAGWELNVYFFQNIIF